MLSVSVSASAGCRIGLGEFGQPRDRQRAFQQGIRRVHMQVHESRVRHVALTNRTRDGAGHGTPLSIAPAKKRERCALSQGTLPQVRRHSVAMTLRPDRNHSEKQGQRSQCGRLFGKYSEHLNSPLA